MVKFVVRQQDDSEAEFPSVHDCFVVGKAKEQDVSVTPRTVLYPVALVKDDERGYYGPILRP